MLKFTFIKNQARFNAIAVFCCQNSKIRFDQRPVCPTTSSFVVVYQADPSFNLPIYDIFL